MVGLGCRLEVALVAGQDYRLVAGLDCMQEVDLDYRLVAGLGYKQEVDLDYMLEVLPFRLVDHPYLLQVATDP